MPRTRKKVVTIHDACSYNLLPLLTTPLADFPSLRGGRRLKSLQVWEYLGMPVQDLRNKEYGCSAGDVAYNDTILAGLNKKLVRGIALTQELKQSLNIPPNIGLDPIEWPVAWRGVMLTLPHLAPNIPRRRKGKSVALEQRAMRETLDRFRATLHQQLDDECSGLYTLVNESPEQASRLIQELLRLGY